MRLADKHILVIGDLMLDRYVYGAAHRLSPEAPVPIVSIEYTEHRLGGAGNVSANIRALGGSVALVAAAGADEDGSTLNNALWEHGINPITLYPDRNRPTSVKTRVIANNQQVVRLDKEDATALSAHTVSALCDSIYTIFTSPKNVNAVVISDYAKGVICPEVLTLTLDLAAANKVPVFLDPKVTHAGLYRGITVMTPNQHEAEGLSGIAIRDKISLERAGTELLSKYGCFYVLITRGEHGMALFSSDGLRMLDIPTEAKAVFDVSGAGDTVIATLALAYSSGMSMPDSAILANRAAGIVVGKQGTAVITKEELETQ